MPRLGDMSDEQLMRLVRDAMYEVAKEIAREAVAAQHTQLAKSTSELVRVASETRPPRWEYLFVRTAGRWIDSINWVRFESQIDIYDHFKRSAKKAGNSCVSLMNTTTTSSNVQQASRMMIALRPITAANWEAVIKLKPAPEQITHIEPNLYSLTEAQYYRAYKPLAIYSEETPVGFLMTFCEAGSNGHYWIDRFMIAADHQGKGYGRAALTLIIGDLKAYPNCNAIYLSHVESNAAAEKLYTSTGFTYTGERDENNERIMLLPVQRPADEGITLKRIGVEDWERCAALEVHDEQKSFVASNMYSLTESHFDLAMVPLGIYHQGQMVGFAMYCTAPEADGSFFIYRLMIEKRIRAKAMGARRCSKSSRR